MKIKLRNKKDNYRKGFSLIESLISLTLCSILVLGSLEFFNLAKVHYFKLKEEHEIHEAVFAALNKMRIDFEEAGYGLLSPVQLGVCSGIIEEGGKITVLSREVNLILSQNLVSGQTRIELPMTSDIKKNRKLCIHDSSRGEILTISSVDAQGIILSSPLSYAYSYQNSTLSLLKTTTYYLDEASKIIRRKVNTSSPQPLLDDTQSLDWSYDETTNLVQISLVLIDREDIRYEISILPKNLELAVKH